MMARKNFSIGAINVALAFLLVLMFGCATTQSPQAPSTSDIQPFLPKSIGYIKVIPLAYHTSKTKLSPYLLLAESEEGKKWIKATPKSRGMFNLSLTQYAIDNGAFKEGRNYYIPAGKIETTVLEQTVDPYLSEGTWEWKGRVAMKVTDLTAIGKTAKKIFTDLKWRPAETNRIFEPGEQEFVLYRSDKRPQWQTRSTFIN